MAPNSRAIRRQMRHSKTSGGGAFALVTMAWFGARAFVAAWDPIMRGLQRPHRCSQSATMVEVDDPWSEDSKFEAQVPDLARIGPAEVQAFKVPCLREENLVDRFSTISPTTVPLRGPIGNSRYAKMLRKQILRSMRDTRNVLVFGENGLYKDMYAYLIHLGTVGRQRQLGSAIGPLLVVDCGGVSKDAARLFGGSGSPGILDQAKDGTLVLNNAHCLNRNLRKDVAALIANSTFTSRVDQTVKKSKLRIIVVTERKVDEFEALPKEVLDTIKIPALRVRREDLRALVKYELRRSCQAKGIPVPGVEDSAFRKLAAYDFPGNVAQLFAFVERALAETPKGGTITAEVFWPAQSAKKLDMFKVDLLEVYPGLRQFLQSDFFPEQLNHGFTKYVFVALVLLLFVGPQTRDANFGLNLFWAWWWPGILLTYPLVGRLWCSICPFMIYGEVVQRYRVAQGVELLKWPTEMMEKWGGWFLFILFAMILVWEECWYLENTAYLSSALLLLITMGAMVASWYFEKRLWCRYMCPIGGMNGLFAKLSLTELRAQKGNCAAECDTYHCYKGGPAEGEGQETSGCPLSSHPASLPDNRNCVLCMTCLKACPHRSVQLNLRAPGVDFGFPFLFPVPGTASSPEHEATAYEVCLMFLLLGAVFCHRLPVLLQQIGYDETAVAAIFDNRGSHIVVAVVTLATPGVIAWVIDVLMRFAGRVFYINEAPPRNFVELAYCYLPLVWLSSLAHYLLLGLSEAGRILPVAARTIDYFTLGIFTSTFSYLEGVLPTLTAPHDVIAFLQGVMLLAGAAFSSLLLQKLGGRAPLVSLHGLLICLFTLELWHLIL